MNRRFLAIAALAFTTVVVLALWRIVSSRLSDPTPMTPPLQSVLTNAVEFGKNRLTGGIGAMVGVDNSTGCPMILAVALDSPAENAGLRRGDLIIKIDGVPTMGRTWVQNIESIKGFSTGSIILTVQRTGTTNLECVIQRRSWKSLGRLNYDRTNIFFNTK